MHCSYASAWLGSQVHQLTVALPARNHRILRLDEQFPRPRAARGNGGSSPPGNAWNPISMNFIERLRLHYLIPVNPIELTMRFPNMTNMQEHRQGRHERGGHQAREVRLPIPGSLLEYAEGDRERPDARAVGDQERPEVVVPCVDEREQGQGDQRPGRHGDRHAEEDPDRAEPVNPRRLLDLAAEAEHELAQEEDAERGEERARQDQARRRCS